MQDFVVIKKNQTIFLLNDIGKIFCFAKVLETCKKIRARIKLTQTYIEHVYKC
jgi:hypothetical protein